VKATFAALDAVKAAQWNRRVRSMGVLPFTREDRDATHGERTANADYYPADVSAVPAPPSPQRWLLPVLIVVVSMMVGGGLLARELYRQPDPQPDAVLALPSTTTRPLEQQPGPSVVELTPDAAAHPQYENVRQLLQTYFDAINNRDYEKWKLTVTRIRIQAKPLADWLKDYHTTRDGSILVYRIDALSDRALRVLIGFTSTQNPQDAPPELPDASCVHWRLTLPVTQEQGRWRLDTVASYTTPEIISC
jgi:hypothetical protein